MRRSILPVVLLASLSLGACETTVDPFIEDDRFFSIFGYLDTATDLQAVRVVPLLQVIADPGDPVDAVVTTTEVETGTVVEWTDTLVDFVDGTQGHVFRGPLRPIPGYSYLMEVVRSDGATTSALTTIPPATQVVVEDPTVSISAAFQKVRWEDIGAAPFRIEVWYRFQGFRPSDPFLNAVVTYQDTKFGEFIGGGWEILVRLSEDREKVAEQLGTAGDTGLTLLGMGARLTMTDDAWRPPGGVFDPEVLVQPGTFSNVEGGFGYFGSVNQFTAEWTLSRQITERIGYTYPAVAED